MVEVNELRYQMFICRKGDVQSGQLPPCDPKGSTQLDQIIRLLFGEEALKVTRPFQTQLMVLDG